MILQVKNEKYKIFVRSGYYTFFKPREYILFVININFYVPVFQLLPD